MVLSRGMSLLKAADVGSQSGQGYIRPLDGAFAPARRSIRARSTEHSRPLDGAFAPFRRSICALSTKVGTAPEVSARCEREAVIP